MIQGVKIWIRLSDTGSESRTMDTGTVPLDTGSVPRAIENENWSLARILDV